MITYDALIKIRRDTASNLTSADETYALGEPVFESDTNKMKIGDGVTAWTSLPYITGSSGNGSLVLNYVAKTANYTAGATDYIINCTSGTFNITFPTAVGITGQVYVVKNSGTGVITILTTSSQTIDGVASGALSLIQFDSLTVQSDGANWLIIGIRPG